MRILDARVKLLLLIGFIAALSFCPSLSMVRVAALAGTLCLIAAFSGVRLLVPLRRALLLMPFAGVFSAILYFGGDKARAIAIVEKTYLSTLCASIVASRTRLPEFAQAARKLGIPSLLTEVMQLIFRYGQVLREQAVSMQTAMRCRGWKRGMVPASGGVAVLFARSLEKSDRLMHAMVSRGYSQNLTWTDGARLRAADYAALIAGASLIGLMVLVR